MSGKELNKQQIEAVEASEGKVRVVAGAGSGKTRVLAHRYAYLVNELGISPANILCMTFTNKAAQEMKQRISHMVDRGNVNDFICTIHGFCVKFLRNEIYRLGFPKTFTIIDEEDAKELAKQAMEEFGIDRKKTTAERFLKQVAGLKGYDPAAYITGHMLPNSPDSANDAIVRFIRLQVKQFCLDFDDLLYFTIYILERFKDVREHWTERLNYIMVDEVQDCSGDDWHLLRILSEKHGNLFVVGDPDQAIYEWRGASPRIFVEFKAHTDIILNRNYRSTPDILDVANSIIDHNRNRVPKELYTTRLNERQPIYRHCKTEKEEAEFVAQTIANGAAQGESYGSFAILYRASFISRRLEQALLARKIPYTVWGGVRFYERREIKDAICYLRLAAGSDDMAFRRIANVPSRKFGKVSMETLARIAESEGKHLYDALRDHISEPPFNRPAMRSFVDVVEQARTLLQAMPVSELADLMLRRSGLLDMYRNDTDEERLENLTELVNAMKEYERTRDDKADATADSYLQQIALYTNADTHTDSDRVRLMTIHQAKGLEFPTVFVAGLTEGVFPSHRTIRERRTDGEEEERRLMYVAATRACSMLYLTESEGYLNDTGALKYPSRYIGEVRDGLLKIEGDPDAALLEGTKRMVMQLDEELGVNQTGAMETGTKVVHKVFGEGVVESYDASNRSYRVKFATGTRNLLPHVLRKL